MNENESTKKYLLYIGLAALILFLIVAFLGRLEFHNELEQEVLPHTLVGYVNDVQYSSDVVVTSDEWPEWAMEYDKPEEAMIHFTGEASGGHIGIFADLIYYENRYERRTWFSGRLLEQASEYYYKPEGALYLEAVYEPGKVPEMSITDMVPQNYDFMAFDGR